MKLFVFGIAFLLAGAAQGEPEPDPTDPATDAPHEPESRRLHPDRDLPYGAGYEARFERPQTRPQVHRPEPIERPSSAGRPGFGSPGRGR